MKDFGSLMKQAQAMQQKLAEAQDRLAQLEVEGTSGGGMVRLVLKGDRVVGEERLLSDRGERIRDVVEGPDGAIWMVTDAEKGKLLRVTPR